MNDVDLFSFTTGAGAIGLSVSPSTYGGMLDASLKLFASDGTLLQSAATSSLSESLGAVVSAGTYFVGVYGAGNYGDLGQYKLSGRIVPVPEPAAALMAVLGATVTAARRRRKA